MTATDARVFDAEAPSQSILGLPGISDMVHSNNAWHTCPVCYDEYMPDGGQVPVTLKTLPADLSAAMTLGELTAQPLQAFDCFHTVCLQCAQTGAVAGNRCPICRATVLGWARDELAVRLLITVRWMRRLANNSNAGAQTRAELDQRIAQLEQEMRATQAARAELQSNEGLLTAELARVRSAQEQQLLSLNQQREQLDMRDRELARVNDELRQRHAELRQRDDELRRRDAELQQLRAQPPPPPPTRSADDQRLIEQLETDKHRYEQLFDHVDMQQQQFRSAAVRQIAELQAQLRSLDAAAQRDRDALLAKDDLIDQLGVQLSQLRASQQPHQHQLGWVGRITSLFSGTLHSGTGVLVQPPDDFHLVERLGDSTASAVWRAVRHATAPPTVYAAKRLRIAEGRSLLTSLLGHHTSSSSTAPSTPLSSSSPTASSSSAAAIVPSGAQSPTSSLLHSTASALFVPSSSAPSSAELTATSSRTLMSVVREALILRAVQHPNVVALFFFVPLAASSEVLLVCEHAGEDLAYAIETRLCRRPQAALVPIAQQILQAVNCLHRSNIVHRGISTASLLFDPASGVVKLAGFREARSLGSLGRLDPLQTADDQRRFLAPEILLNPAPWSPPQPDDWKACDMWSVGVVLADLTVGGQLLHSSLVVESMLTVEEISNTFPPADRPSLARGLHCLGALRDHVAARNPQRADVFSPAWYALVAQLLVYQPGARAMAQPLLRQCPLFDQLPLAPVSPVTLRVADDQLVDFATNYLGFRNLV